MAHKHRYIKITIIHFNANIIEILLMDNETHLIRLKKIIQKWKCTTFIEYFKIERMSIFMGRREYIYIYIPNK